MAEADGELVRRVLAGDRAAFEVLVTTHLGRVRAVAAGVVGRDPGLLDDIAQNTFLHAYRALGQLAEPHAFPSWVCTIARNEAVTWLRRNARHRATSLDAAPIAAPEADAGRDLAPLRTALAELPASYREILALKYDAGLNYEQIADSLGISVINVEKRLYRARQALLAKLPAP
jgi:RNA polymerase sigma-70 factor (ECF subfamily)